MVAGLLKEIIEIHSPFQIKNEYGEIEDTFKKAYKTKSQVIYQSGNKTVENNEIFIDYSIQFIIRIYHKVTENDRVKYDGKFYQINSIERSKQFQLIKLNCSLINE